MILVMGATGHVGAKITSFLLSANQKVRCLARHFPQKDQFAGAELIQGDANSVDTLSQAMKDCRAVFTMIPQNLLATDMQYDQNKLSAVIAEAIEESGTKKVVNLSCVGANLQSSAGPIMGFHDQEQELERLAHVDILNLRPAYLMENLFQSIQSIISTSRIYDVIPSEVPLSMIAAQDIAAHAAFLLMNPKFTGHEVEYLLGERDLTFTEVTKILRKVLKKEDLEYEEVLPNKKLKLLGNSSVSSNWSAAYLELGKAIGNGTIAGSVQRTKLNTTATSFEIFASKTFYEAYMKSVQEEHAKRLPMELTKDHHP